MCQIYFLNASSVVVMIGFRINPHTLHPQPTTLLSLPQGKNKHKTHFLSKEFVLWGEEKCRILISHGLVPRRGISPAVNAASFICFFQKRLEGLSSGVTHISLRGATVKLGHCWMFWSPCGWWDLFYQTPAPVFEFSAWLREVFTHLLATLLFVQLLNTHSL